MATTGSPSRSPWHTVQFSVGKIAAGLDKYRVNNRFKIRIVSLVYVNLNHGLLGASSWLSYSNTGFCTLARFSNFSKSNQGTIHGGEDGHGNFGFDQEGISKPSKRFIFFVI